MTTDDSSQETGAAPEAEKQPRARWSEAQIVRLSANKDENSAALCLLKALVALNIAHGTVDAVFGAPAGTTMKFLRTDADQPGLSTADVDHLLVLLVALHGEGALKPRGLDLALTLRVMVRSAVAQA